MKSNFKCLFNFSRWSFLSAITLVCLTILVSCKKLVEVGAPSTGITSDNIYSNDNTAVSVLTGIYSKISATSPLGGGSDQIINGVSLRGGLVADELSLIDGIASAAFWLIPYYTNSISPTAGFTMWDEYYYNLYVVNIAIERLTESQSLSNSVKNQLIGEAKFLRAFFLFYLTNLYGDIPLTVSSDYRINSNLSRTSQHNVYLQIVSDLKDAQALLGEQYFKPDAKTAYPIGVAERVRPNKWVATALLARVYLYMGDWSNAITEATTVINQNDLFELEGVASVFLKNSKEAIWQLQPVNAGWNTEDAITFVLPEDGPNGYLNPVFLDSNHLVNNFEYGDLRKENWIQSVTPSSGIRFYYPTKYKSATLDAPVTEYLMVFRLAEQYLIRAEALAQENEISKALESINIIRSRAGLNNLEIMDKPALLSQILHERQVELFTEWGHRWFDLQRFGEIDNIMGSVCPQKGSVWNTNYKLFPIPIYDIQQNGNLKQNPGY